MMHDVDRSLAVTYMTAAGVERQVSPRLAERTQQFADDLYRRHHVRAAPLQGAVEDVFGAGYTFRDQLKTLPPAEREVWARAVGDAMQALLLEHDS